MTSLTLALTALTLNANPAPAPAPVPVDAPHVRQAVKRSLVYLEKNKFGFGCISCHDGAWMIWSHHEADRRGFNVNRKSLDLIQTRAVKSYAGHPDFKPTGMDQIHDFSANTMYLTQALVSSPTLDAETNALLDRFAAYIVKKQRDDGHWQANANGEAKGPPLIDRHDSTTLWALMALTAREHTGSLKDDVARSREKGLKWLRDNPSSETLQAVALRVLVMKRLGTAEEALAAQKELQARQNADGGWSQVKDKPSDALGTGQALVALTGAGLTAADPAIAKAWGFLLNSQKPDGSWYVLSRQERGENAREQFRAASFMGSAWAVLGLLRSLPVDPSESVREEKPLPSLKERVAQNPKALDLYGTPVTDGDLKDLAGLAELQTLDLGHTKVTDAGLKELSQLKQLQSLDLTFAAAVTDAGLKDLANLPQLKQLNLEGTAVTDAGLKELADMKQLKILQLRGTKVTNQAIEEFRKTFPGVQVSR